MAHWAAEQPDTQGETSDPQSCQGRLRPNDPELLRPWCLAGSKVPRSSVEGPIQPQSAIAGVKEGAPQYEEGSRRGVWGMACQLCDHRALSKSFWPSLSGSSGSVCRSTSRGSHPQQHQNCSARGAGEGLTCAGPSPGPPGTPGKPRLRAPGLVPLSTVMNARPARGVMRGAVQEGLAELQASDNIRRRDTMVRT